MTHEIVQYHNDMPPEKNAENGTPRPPGAPEKRHSCQNIPSKKSVSFEYLS